VCESSSILQALLVMIAALRIIFFALPTLIAATDQLLLELEQELGASRRQALEVRAAPIKELLRPIFSALPRPGGAGIGRAASRYALHRHFVQEKGWFVKGLQELDPTGGLSNISVSPVEILQDRVPAAVKAVFQQHLDEHGLELSELALLAAALEELVHRETMSVVGSAFRAKRVPLIGRVQVDEVGPLLDYVMMSHILEIANISGTNIDSGVDPKEYLQGKRPMEDIYPNWPKTQKFLRDIQGAVAPAERGSLSFEDLMHIIEEVLEHYGRFHNGECLDMKTDLLKMEGQCPGQVDLPRFYSASLYDSKWQYSESLEYLRALGALDESQPGRAGVVVSNYVLGASNCIGTSRYYAQCCVDPCDNIMAKLEKALAAPEASPADIAAAVAAVLPPSSARPEILRRRLFEVAWANGGKVPLHGRLFAQWLHHAYPQECPVPPVAGSQLRQELPRDFTLRTGKDYIASAQEMMMFAPKKVDSNAIASRPCELAWTSGEELLEAPVGSEGLVLGVSSGCALAFGAASVALMVLVVALRLQMRQASARGPLLAAEATGTVV